MDLAVIFDAFCRLLFIIDELCLHKFSNVVFCITNFFIKGKIVSDAPDRTSLSNLFLGNLIYISFSKSIESNDCEHQRVSTQNYNALGDLVGIGECAGNSVWRDGKVRFKYLMDKLID